MTKQKKRKAREWYLVKTDRMFEAMVFPKRSHAMNYINNVESYYILEVVQVREVLKRKKRKK